MKSSDPLSSKLYDIMHTKTAVEDRELIVARDKYRAEWHKKWTDEGLDFILTVPISLPAIENGASEKTTLICAGYTFLFSVVRVSLYDPSLSNKLTFFFLAYHCQLDYAAGVLPVTHVDKNLDKLPKEFASSDYFRSLSSVAKAAYGVYDAEKMHGLPLGVQVVGRRLEEEKVLEGMQVIETALRQQSSVFLNKVKL